MVVVAPAVLRGPLQEPDAVQLLVLVVVQLRVVDCPLIIVDGDTVTFTVGAGSPGMFTVTVTLSVTGPSMPSQVSV